MKLTFFSVVLSACSLGMSGTLLAASLDVDVRDIHGNALPDAAIYIESAAGASAIRPRRRAVNTPVLLLIAGLGGFWVTVAFLVFA